MICKKCKKEIDNNARFCIYCGSKTDTSVNFDIKTLKEKAHSFLAPLENGQVLFIVTLFLLLLNPIFAAFKNVNISENLTGSNMISQSYSLFDFLIEFAKYIPFIFLPSYIFLIVFGIGAIIVAALSMLFPLIKQRKYTAKYLIMTKTISIIILLVMLFWYILMFASYYSSNAVYIDLRITFGGWLFILDSIALVITSFKLSSIVKKNNIKVMNKFE